MPAQIVAGLRSFGPVSQFTLYVFPLTSLVRKHDPFLSGLGRAERDIYPLEPYAPVNPSRRYDDKDYSVQESDYFHLRHRVPRHDGGDRDVGYSMHHRCWQLLCHWAPVRGVEAMSSARHVRFLYQLHHSTLDGMGSDWAGDYGGLLGMQCSYG